MIFKCVHILIVMVTRFWIVGLGSELEKKIHPIRKFQREENITRYMDRMNSLDEIILRGRLNGAQRTRLKKLLDMLYKPGELAEEVGFNVRQVYRVYIPAGCPHERDDRRHIWINGEAFRNWFEETYKKRNIDSSEAFCLTCKKAMKMVEPVEKREGRLVYYLCDCPNCGRKLARIVQRKKRGTW